MSVNMVTDKDADAAAFREAVDALRAGISYADLAGALGCSRSTINQARLSRLSRGARTPPPGWREGLAPLVKRRIAEYEQLLNRLAAEA